MIGFEIRNMFNTGMFSIGDPTNERMLHLPSWVGAKPGQFLVLMDAAEWHELSREDEPVPKLEQPKAVWEAARDYVLTVYATAYSFLDEMTGCWCILPIPRGTPLSAIDFRFVHEGLAWMSAAEILRDRTTHAPNKDYFPSSVSVTEVDWYGIRSEVTR